MIKSRYMITSWQGENYSQLGESTVNMIGILFTLNSAVAPFITNIIHSKNIKQGVLSYSYYSHSFHYMLEIYAFIFEFTISIKRNYIFNFELLYIRKKFNYFDGKVHLNWNERKILKHMGSLPQYIWGHYVAFLGCVECISSEKETLKVLRVPTRKENRTIAVKGQIILCASLIFQNYQPLLRWIYVLYTRNCK